MTTRTPSSGRSTRDLPIPTRVCISGASYGGYAVLRAFAKTPAMFKCGVAGTRRERPRNAAQLDRRRYRLQRIAAILFWHRTRRSERQPTRRRFATTHRSTWPSQIKAPVFMYAGADDIRTPSETDFMAMAKRTRVPPGNLPKAVAHQVGRRATASVVSRSKRRPRTTKMLQFLDDNIGPKAALKRKQKKAPGLRPGAFCLNEGIAGAGNLPAAAVVLYIL